MLVEAIATIVDRPKGGLSNGINMVNEELYQMAGTLISRRRIIQAIKVVGMTVGVRVASVECWQYGYTGLVSPTGRRYRSCSSTACSSGGKKPMLQGESKTIARFVGVVEVT